MVKNSPAKHEQGQVLVLLVVALVVLLGFTALAVDGSMVYSDRRFTQSVADAAALAGGREAAQYAKEHNVTSATLNCNSSLKNIIKSASQSSAAINDINIDANLANKNGVEVDCDDGVIRVHTMVTHVTETNFAHFVFGNSLTNTVEAVAELQLGNSGSQAAAGGIGLLTLSPHGSGALELTGSGRIGVQNGGIYVNSDHNNAMKLTGSGTIVGKTISVVGGSSPSSGSGNFDVVDTFSIGKNVDLTGSGQYKAGNGINVNGNLSLTGSGSVRSASIFVNGNLSLNGSGSVRATSTLFVNGTTTKTGSGTISPAPVSTGAPLPVNPVPDPLASVVIPVPQGGATKPAGTCVNFVLSGSGAQTINPGCYSKIELTGSGHLTLNPGLYWITGSTGFNVTGSGSVTVGAGSTFHFENGSFSKIGSGDFTAPQSTFYIPNGSFSFTGSGDFTAPQSTYYIDHGSFSLTGSGSITAPEVFFYLGPSAGTFTLTGSGNLNVSAKTSGPYKGLTLYAKTGTGVVSLTGSGSIDSLKGTIYIPTRPLTLTGSGGTTVFDAQIICNTATLTGSGNLSLRYDGNQVYQIESSGDILLSLVE